MCGGISFLNDCVLTLKARKAVSFGARSFPCTEMMTPAALASVQVSSEFSGFCPVAEQRLSFV